jgi:hypothetical protein
LPTLIANDFAHTGEEQAEIFVDLGRRADRGAIRAAGVFVRNGDRGRDAVDSLGLWLIKLFEKLPRVGGKAFDITPLPLGIEGVEGHAGFAAARDTAKHDELPPRQVEVDLAKVVDGDAAELDGVLAHPDCSQCGSEGEVESFMVCGCSAPVDQRQSGIIRKRRDKLRGVAVSRSDKFANPFYGLLIATGIVFAITAVSYGVMAFRDARPPAVGAGERAPQQADHPLLVWMSRHGEAALLTEVAFLAVFTFGAIGTDDYWQRRAARDGRKQ